MSLFYCRGCQFLTTTHHKEAEIPILEEQCVVEEQCLSNMSVCSTCETPASETDVPFFTYNEKTICINCYMSKGGRDCLDYPEEVPYQYDTRVWCVMCLTELGFYDLNGTFECDSCGKEHDVLNCRILPEHNGETPRKLCQICHPDFYFMSKVTFCRKHYNK